MCNTKILKEVNTNWIDFPYLKDNSDFVSVTLKALKAGHLHTRNLAGGKKDQEPMENIPECNASSRFDPGPYRRFYLQIDSMFHASVHLYITDHVKMW